MISFAVADVQAEPWWMAAIVGPYGGLLLLAFVSWSLWSELKKSREEVAVIAKESVQVITLSLDRHKEAKEATADLVSANRDLRAAIEKLANRVDDNQWHEEISHKLDKLLAGA